LDTRFFFVGEFDSTLTEKLQAIICIRVMRGGYDGGPRLAMLGIESNRWGRTHSCPQDLYAFCNKTSLYSARKLHTRFTGIEANDKERASKFARSGAGI
jgi:hypothetical protein